MEIDLEDSPGHCEPVHFSSFGHSFRLRRPTARLHWTGFLWTTVMFAFLQATKAQVDLVLSKTAGSDAGGRTLDDV